MLKVKKINCRELLRKHNKNEEFQLLTIADNSDFLPEKIPYTLVTFSEVEKNFSMVREDIPVIIACNEGEKSYFLAAFIERHGKLNNIFSLEGGFKSLKNLIESET